MLRPLLLAGATLAAISVPRATRAQTCHAPAEFPHRELSVDVTFEKATVDLDVLTRRHR